MEEREFRAVADAELAALENTLARLQDDGAIDFDYEVKPGGIIEIALADDSRIIVNRHVAAREIWVAARSGGFHFRFDGNAWVDTREGTRLAEVISRCFTAQAGAEVRLAW